MNGSHRSTFGSPRPVRCSQRKAVWRTSSLFVRRACAPGSTHLRLPFPRLFPWFVVRPLLSPVVIPFGKLALLVVAVFGGMRVVHSGRIAVHYSLLHAVGSCNCEQNPDPTESNTRHSHATPRRGYQESSSIEAGGSQQRDSSAQTLKGLAEAGISAIA